MRTKKPTQRQAHARKALSRSHARGHSKRLEDRKAVLLAGGSEPTVVIRSDPAAAVEELKHQLDTLDYFVIRAYPEGHPIRSMFNFILKPEIDNYVPPREELMGLKNRFFTLPLAERRRVLNGWTPRRDWPLEQDVRNSNPSCCVHQVMTLESSARSEHSEIYVDHGFTIDDAIGPVHLIIGAGQPREQVIDRLQRLLDFLRLHWDDAVRGDRNFATWRKDDASGYFENLDVEGQVQP